MKVVITGGPSGGKTALAQLIEKEFGDEIAIVPEAASILFRGGFPRGSSPDSVKSQQRAIYYVQRELEKFTEQKKHGARLILCDRGSLDGMAYWPGNQSGFLRELQSNMKKELARYQWVMHLDTADSEHYDTSNPVRLETYQKANSLNKKIRQVWSQHPQHLIIPKNQNFSDKLNLCLVIIRMIIQGAKQAEIQRYIEVGGST